MSQEFDPKNTPNLAKQRLGRGLAALMGNIDNVETQASVEDGPHSKGITQKINIKDISPNPNNPRKLFIEDDLLDLVQSIKEHGVIQPILVRKKAYNNYEIIAGERRFTAAGRAGLKEIPVIIYNIDDKQALEFALIENIQREDLNVIEEAQAYEQLIAKYNYSQEQLSDIIGKSRSHIANMMRLLKLPEAIQDMVQSNILSYGHARCLIGCDNVQEIADIIIRDGLSVRQSEALVKKHNQLPSSIADILSSALKSSKKQVKSKKNELIIGLEQALTSLIAAPVVIDQKKQGGEIKISYKNTEDLEKICNRLKNGS